MFNPNHLDVFGSSALNIFRINKYLGMFPVTNDFKVDKICVALGIILNVILGLCLIRSAQTESEKTETKDFLTYGVQSSSVWLCGVGCAYLTAAKRQEISLCYKTALSLLRQAESLSHDVVRFPSDLTYLDAVSVAGLVSSLITSAFLYDWHLWPNCASSASMFYWAVTLSKLMEIRAFVHAGVVVSRINRAYVFHNRCNIWAKGKNAFIKSLSIYHDTGDYCRLVNKAYKDILLLLVANVFLASTTELYLSFTYVDYTDRILSKVTSYVMCSILFLALFDVLWYLNSTNRQAKMYNCAIRDSMIFVPESLQYKSAEILKSHLTASRSIQYTAAGYFELDVSLLSSVSIERHLRLQTTIQMAGAVATYLFIILQLNAP